MGTPQRTVKFGPAQPAPLLYVTQDGFAPSGVTTYGLEVLRANPDARMLWLNADAPPPGLEPGMAERVVPVGTAESHAPAAVAQVLARMVESAGGATLLPNTGDTSWAATAEFLRHAPAAVRECVRVLGIVHSDMDTQYALAEQYRLIAPVWIGVSRRCADELQRRVGSLGVTVLALPYPIAWRPSAARPDSGPLRLAYVGRLEEPQKRVSRLVELFSVLERRGVDFVATVVGDGPAAGEFRRALAQAGPAVGARVRCTGVLDRGAIDEVWRTHDVALLVSAYEGLPVALLEAMASGVCPVAMAIDSGVAELLRDGSEGRIVPQGDVAGMAEVLGQLACDRAGLRRLGSAAQERVRSEFPPDRHFQRLAAAVSQVWLRTGDVLPPDTVDETGRAANALAARARSTGRPVAVFGAGMFGRKVIDACLDNAAPVIAIFDSDPARWGTGYRGLVCQAPETVVARPEACFLAASLQFSAAIAERIRQEFAGAGRPQPEILLP